MKVGDILECKTSIPETFYNQEYNVGDKAIVISLGDMVFRVKGFNSDIISIFYNFEYHYFKSISNRKSRIENLQL